MTTWSLPIGPEARRIQVEVIRVVALNTSINGSRLYQHHWNHIRDRLVYEKHFDVAESVEYGIVQAVESYMYRMCPVLQLLPMTGDVPDFFTGIPAYTALS
jgi:hypothetical protein